MCYMWVTWPIFAMSYQFYHSSNMWINQCITALHIGGGGPTQASQAYNSDFIITIHMTFYTLKMLHDTIHPHISPYTPHIHVYQPYWYHHSATYPSRMYWCVASPPVVFTFCLLCVLQVPPISYKTYLCLTNPTSHIYKSQLYFTYGCCV